MRHLRFRKFSSCLLLSALVTSACGGFDEPDTSVASEASPEGVVLQPDTETTSEASGITTRNNMSRNAVIGFVAAETGADISDLSDEEMKRWADQMCAAGRAGTRAAANEFIYETFSDPAIQDRYKTIDNLSVVLGAMVFAYGDCGEIFSN